MLGVEDPRARRMWRVIAAADNRKAVPCNKQRCDEVLWGVAAAWPDRSAEFRLDNERGADGQPECPESDEQDHDKRASEREDRASPAAEQGGQTFEQGPDEPVPARSQQAGACGGVTHGKEDAGEGTQNDRASSAP